MRAATVELGCLRLALALPEEDCWLLVVAVEELGGATLTGIGVVDTGANSAAKGSLRPFATCFTRWLALVG